MSHNAKSSPSGSPERRYFVYDPRAERGQERYPVGKVTPDLPGGEMVVADSPGKAKATYVRRYADTDFTTLRAYRMYPCERCGGSGSEGIWGACPRCYGEGWHRRDAEGDGFPDDVPNDPDAGVDPRTWRTW